MSGNFESAFPDYGAGKSMCLEFVAPNVLRTARSMTWAVPRTMGVLVGPFCKLHNVPYLE